MLIIGKPPGRRNTNIVTFLWLRKEALIPVILSKMAWALLFLPLSYKVLFIYPYYLLRF